MKFEKLLDIVHSNCGLDIKKSFNLALFLLVGRSVGTHHIFERMGILDIYNQKNIALYNTLKPYYNTGSFPDYLLGDGISKIYMEMYQKYIAKGGNANAQYFTPTCVSENLFDLIDDGREYPLIGDLACGTGSLFNGVMKKYSSNKNSEVYFAHQDIDENVNLLCELQLKINGFSSNESFCGDILKDYDNTMGQRRGDFDYLLINPPFGLKTEITPHKFLKDLKVASKESEWAFVLASLDLLNDSGKCAAVMPLGSLFRDSGKLIRQKIIKNIQTVILLPNKMFLNTDIPCCIILLSKQDNDKILFIDAANDFSIDGKRSIWDPTKVKSLLSAPHNIDGYSAIKKVDGASLEPKRFIKSKTKTVTHNIHELNKELKEINVKLEKSKEKMSEIWSQVANIQKQSNI